MPPSRGHQPVAGWGVGVVVGGHRGLDPSALVTEMSTVDPPDGPAGGCATSVVSEVTVNEAGVVPNRTPVAPVKL